MGLIFFEELKLFPPCIFQSALLNQMKSEFNLKTMLLSTNSFCPQRKTKAGKKMYSSKVRSIKVSSTTIINKLLEPSLSEEAQEAFKEFFLNVLISNSSSIKNYEDFKDSIVKILAPNKV